jgi:hypothetical protein
MTASRPPDDKRKSKKPRYRLHWNSSGEPRRELKWAIYDWRLICPVAYSETRVGGRRLCAFLNAEA